MEVRCCCTPEKLLGWLWVARPQLTAVVCALRSALGGVECERLVLDIAEISDCERGARWRAVKSDHVPIETLRRIPSFVENLYP